MSIKSYEDLRVWQLAMELSVGINQLTLKFPRREQYGLTSQLRRASISIPSNIAEGWARPTRVYINHLRIALGSEAELKTQLHLAARMNYVTEADVSDSLSRASEIGRMLRSLIASLNRRA